MMTPVGQRSTHNAQRVQTSSSTTKNTWSLGSSPGASALTASSTASVDSMWMHFQGQMSTQPSQRMHSAWSMWRNCLGLTAWVSQFGSTSWSTYDVENSGIGGFASVRAMSMRSLAASRDTRLAGARSLASSLRLRLRSPRRVTVVRARSSWFRRRCYWAAVGADAFFTARAESGERAPARHRRGLAAFDRRLRNLALLPRDEQEHVQHEHHNVDTGGHPVDELVARDVERRKVRTPLVASQEERRGAEVQVRVPEDDPLRGDHAVAERQHHPHAHRAQERLGPS